VTADYDVVPEDPWCYREALVQGFRRYGITVEGVPDLSEDALRWRPPERVFRAPELAFRRLRFGRELGEDPGVEELTRRGEVVGELVTADAYYFGLAPWSARARGVEKPCVQSVRALRRVGPDGNLNLDLVAEITQRRRTARGAWIYGGATVVFDRDGWVRYAINKYVRSERRERRLEAFLADDPSRREALGGSAEEIGRLIRRMHAHRD
jgi:hypothetical protein